MHCRKLKKKPTKKQKQTHRYREHTGGHQSKGGCGGNGKIGESESHSAMSDSSWPHGLYINSPWNSPGQNTGVSLSLLQGIFPTQGSNLGIEPRSPSLQENSLPTEPPGKPKNTGVGSLSLPQQIFPTQESNWDLLYCRWTLPKELSGKP